MNDKLNTDTDIRDVERDYDDLKSHNDVEEKGLDVIFQEKKKFVLLAIVLVTVVVCKKLEVTLFVCWKAILANETWTGSDCYVMV